MAKVHLSDREKEAKKAGVAVDYSKSAKQQGKVLPKAIVPQVQKKAVYDVKSGVTKVVSQQPKPVVYGPAVPKGFKAQMSAVKNYSVPPKNYTPAKNFSSVDDQPDDEQRKKEEALKKSVAEAQRAREEADKAGSLWGMTKNTVKGLFKKDTYKKAATKEGLKEGYKATGELLYSIPKTVAREAISAGLSTGYGQKKLGGRINPEEDFGPTGAKILGKGQIGGWQQRTEKIKKTAQEGVDFNKAVFGTEGKKRTLTEGQSKLFAPVLLAGSVLSNVVTGGKSKVGKEVVERAARESVEAGAKKSIFSDVGRTIVRDAEIRAAGNEALSRDVAGAGRRVAESMSTPRAKAASFVDDAAMQADNAGNATKKAVEEAPVAKSTRKVGEDINEVPQAPKEAEKAPVARTRVAKLNESADTIRTKVTKALDDIKNQVDEFDVDGNPIPKKNPMDEIQGDIDNFKKEFEDLTGEKAPDDIDALITRLKDVEAENKGAWVREDKAVTRGRDLSSRAGVRQFTPNVKGKRGGILINARKKKLAEREQLKVLKESDQAAEKQINKALRDSLDEYAVRLEKKIDSKNFSGPDHFEQVHREYAIVGDLMKRLDDGKLTPAERLRANEYLMRRGIDVSKKTVPEVPKKADGAIRQIVPTETSGRVPASEKPVLLTKDTTPARPVFTKNGEKLGSESFGNGGNVPRGTEAKLPPMPKKGPIRQWVSEVGTRTREVIQDNWIRVKKLQERPDVVIDGTKLTPYEAETLFHGRVGTRITEANDALKAIDKEIADLEKITKNAGVRKEIDRYLVAKHAPERNAVHGEGAAGMTNAEADEIVKAFEGDSKNKAAVAVAEKIKTLNDKTLDLLRDSQVIDEDMYQKLRTAYKNHVPLNRIFDETDDVGSALVGRGYDVRGSGIKRAKGSQREVDDILSNVGANLEQAIVRAEKNRVNLSVLEFARENKNLGLFTEIKPKAIGQSFDGRPLLERVDDPLVLTVRENGKPVYLRINDERLATAFKGIGTEKLPPLLNFVGGFTRIYSGLATRFNPEFVFSNKLRDLQEMAAYMAAQKNVGFSGAAKTALRDPISMKDVTDFMRGADTPGAKLYKQMMEDGGTTGGMALSTRKQFKIDVESMRQMNRGGVLNLKKNGKKIVETFDNWNQIFEDSTRLSVYKTALDRGLSRDRAAFLAKNATINFNKKGTGGAILNSMYMFSNASIQGTTKLLTAMKNPKVASAVVGSVGTAVWAANSWNDKVDPDWRDKVSKFDRNSNLVVVLPTDSGAKYITIPVSWGLKPIKVMADYSYDASNGKASDKSGYQIAGDVLSSIWDGYNPIGGSDVTSALVPTPLDIPVEIARNKKWSGSVIHPDSKEGVPESENFFKNKEGVPSDKSFQFDVLRRGSAGVAKATDGNIQLNPANLKYALDGYLSGLGRFGTGLFETGKAFSEKGVPQASDAPFARRFYKTKTDEEITKVQKMDARQTLRDTLKSMPREEQSAAIQEYLNSLPADQRKGASYGLMQEGFNTKGTSVSDDIIRMKPTYDKVQQLVAEGKTAEAEKIVDEMSDEDYKAYRKAKTSDNRKKMEQLDKEQGTEMDNLAKKVQEMVADDKEQDAVDLVNSLSDEEYKLYQRAKKRLNIK